MNGTWITHDTKVWPGNETGGDCQEKIEPLRPLLAQLLYDLPEGPEDD